MVTSIPELSGPMVLPRSGNAPQHIVAILHGLGADGRNMIELGKVWSHHMPDTLFVAPNAPFPFSGGPVGYEWFDVGDRTSEFRREGLRVAAPILDAFLDDLLQTYNLDNQNLALVGFSQGTMMALHVGLRRPQCAGIVGYSGALIEDDLPQSFARPPVVLIHGDSDTILDDGYSRRAESYLKAHQVPVTLHVTPDLDHSIDVHGFEEGERFLHHIFALNPKH